MMRRVRNLEEKRQLALLRHALKHHEWYYCAGTVCHDMTHTLQRSMALVSQLHDSDGSLVKNKTIISQEEVPESFETDDGLGIGQEEELQQEEGEDVVVEATSGSNNTDVTNEESSRVPDLPRRARRWWEADSDHVGERPDSRFFWNEAVTEPLLRQWKANATADHTFACEICLEHVIPVTSLFFGVQTNLSVSAAADKVRYDEVLISRRSRFRAGTRFTKRGADATGAVANYAETEQILLVWQPTNGRDTTIDGSNGANSTLRAVVSHVQTRGSIPLRWSSPTDIKTYRPRVRIGTDPLAQARSLRQHLTDQATRYILLPHTNETEVTTNSALRGGSLQKRKRKHPSLIFVNLVDKKSDQGRLGRALDAVLNAVIDVYKDQPDSSFPWLNPSHIQHLWFDFHAEVKSGRWDKLAGLLEQVKPTILEQGYFLAVPSNSTDSNFPFHIERLQTGVIRTNCMDCLDRTNVVQSMFGRYALFRHLSDTTLVPLGYKTVFRKNSLTLPWTSGEVAHRLLWADNADAISRLYAGTPALKGDFTRTGRRTKKGALDDGMNSLQRYYLNNFMDADRQEGMDLLVGHQGFSTLDSAGEEDVGSESALSLRDGIVHSGMTVQEAARQMLLGAWNAGSCDDDDDDESHHVRIKQKRRRLGPPSKGVAKTGRRHRVLDLRWLPGDLQTQVRSLASPWAGDEATSMEKLEAIDRRAASDLPWWVVANSEEGEGEQTSSAVLDVETAAANNAGYLLAALAAGTRAPLAMAAVVMSILSVSWPDTAAETEKAKNS
jgi:hypothetical protein